MLMSEIERFFLPPSKKCPDERRPLLYLSRRDLVKLYGNEDSNLKRNVTSPLLTSLGIMVGFELLTKIWAGEPRVYNNTIKGFFKSALGLSENEAEALTQFRHAIAHGYGLKAKPRKSRYYYYFTLSDSKAENQFLKETKLRHFSINVWALKSFFISSIANYKKILLIDKALKAKFHKVKKHLEIKIG